MASFWDTLKESGTNLASKVLTPLGAGIGKGITNLVQQGQNKVSVLADNIVKTTNPNKPTASQPATPPTTGLKPTAKTEATLGILMVVAVIVLILYMRGKK